MALPEKTPANNPFALPNPELAVAIAKEWEGGKKYSPSNMPLTALAYTAIDRIAFQKDSVVEVLMVYVDSDTLTYRASGSQELSKLQEEKWGEVLKWAGGRFDVVWQTTSGVMPVEQSEVLHNAIKRYLESLDEWQLSVFCVLSSGFSSLVLAIAVCEEYMSAAAAFDISRLEEEAQAQQWGRDEEAEARAQKMKSEIVDAERFLHLLKSM